MGRLDILRTELTTDPLDPQRGYAGMDDVAAAADLNTAYRTRNIPTLTGSEVMNAIDKTEFGLLSAEAQRQVWDILHLGTINPFGLEADLMQDIFGAGATITALQAIRKESISRATELRLGKVTVGDIQTARL